MYRRHISACVYMCVSARVRLSAHAKLFLDNRRQGYMTHTSYQVCAFPSSNSTNQPVTYNLDVKTPGCILPVKTVPAYNVRMFRTQLHSSVKAICSSTGTNSFFLLFFFFLSPTKSSRSSALARADFPRRNSESSNRRGCSPWAIFWCVCPIELLNCKTNA